MTYSATKRVYYGPERTMKGYRIRKGVSLDEAKNYVAQIRDRDLKSLNAVYGEDTYADVPVWPVDKHVVYMIRLAPSQGQYIIYRPSQPREVLYEIWEEAEPDKKYKEENTMTNAEMAKQVKEFAERLDRYYANQEEAITKYDDKLEELTDKVDGLGIVAQETTRQLKEQNISLTEAYSNLNGRLGDYKKQQNDKLESIEQRLNSMDDTATYVRQVAEESKKIEEALKVSARKLDLFSQKNLELMERNKRLSEQNVKLQEEIKAANKMCDNVSKKASKLADRVQKLEADSSRILRLEDRVWEHEDKLAKASKLDDRMQQFETALMQLRLNISSISSVYGIPEEAKTLESMYPCLWKCEHKGKECDGLAQECPLAKHFSKEWVPYNYCEKDLAVTMEVLEWHNKKQQEKKDIIFSEFNAGKRAIVFSDGDYLEKDYIDFCREFVKWQERKTKKESLCFKCVNFFDYLRPFLKQPSIYDDREPFVIWLDTQNDEYTSDFQYGSLQSTWREHDTVGGIPYTEWSV